MKKQLIFIILALIVVKVIIDWDPMDAVVGEYPVAGKATWYSDPITATGEHVDDDALTCALRKKDYGKYYQVCSADNGKCVMVRHNDFGPRKRLFMQGRIIDLSPKAFLELADLKTGIINVMVREVKSDPTVNTLGE